MVNVSEIELFVVLLYVQLYWIGLARFDRPSLSNLLDRYKALNTGTMKIRVFKASKNFDN